MTIFSAFTDEELDAMESAFCNEGYGFLIEELRRERRFRDVPSVAPKSDSEEIIEVEPTMVYPIKEKHVYASCKCCLPTSYGLDLGEKQPGKHKYRFKCAFCGYSGFVFA